MRQCAVKSNVGRVRSTNEDCCAVSVLDEPLADWSGPLQPGCWAIVADGMGGHAAGEVASAVAVAVMRELLRETLDEQGVRAALTAANQSLYGAMDDHPELTAMGTTIAGVILREAGVLIFNVGDSRVYLRTTGGLTQLTEDHVVEGHMLTQCLGGVQRAAKLSPFIREVSLRPEDELLICSDGLTDMLTDQQISGLWEATPSYTADGLVAAALDAGGADNVSVVVIGAASDH